MTDAGTTFEDELEAIGFVDTGDSRRGGRQWTLVFNRYLTFTVHDFGDALVVSWSLALGDYVLTRDMQIGAGETTFQELYPQRDVRIPVSADAVRAEVTRVLGALRFDFADPTL